MPKKCSECGWKTYLSSQSDYCSKCGGRLVPYRIGEEFKVTVRKYGGIEEGYPRVRKRFGKLASYAQLLRPVTLVAPLFAGILGIFASTKMFNLEILLVAIYAGLTLALTQMTGQVVNQYADVELDEIIKPYRPLPSGMISKEEALGLAWILAIVSIGRAFTITRTFGLATLLLLFFAVFYSLSPFSPRKIHPLFNLLWMATSRGLIPVLAIWSIYGDLTKALPYALISFTWVLGFQSTKDVGDTRGDLKFGIKTIYNQYGQKGLRATMLIGTIACASLIIYYQMYPMLFMMPVAVVSIVGANIPSKKTENTFGWIGFYAGLALIFVLTFINEVFNF